MTVGGRSCFSMQQVIHWAGDQRPSFVPGSGVLGHTLVFTPSCFIIFDFSQILSLVYKAPTGLTRPGPGTDLHFQLFFSLSMRIRWGSKFDVKLMATGPSTVCHADSEIKWKPQNLRRKQTRTETDPWIRCRHCVRGGKGV